MGAAQKPGSGKPSAGPHTQGGSHLTIGQDGRIIVRSGDTIAKYAQALYGDPQRGWEEFGRLRGGVLDRLADPNRIAVGETLYHMPTAATHLPVLLTTALDAAEVHRFFHSVAWRTALAQSARLVWNNERGSFLKVVGVDLYNLTAGKLLDKLPPSKWEPPSAEVRTGRDEDIGKRASKLREEYWSRLLARGAQGAGAAMTYLKSLDAQRTDAIKQLNDLHREAMHLNRGIENEISRGLKWVAGTKFAADVGVTLVGFTPGGLLVKTGVQAIYGGANYMIQTQVASDEAQAAASKQLVVGFTQSVADVAAEGAAKAAQKFAEASGAYSAEAAAVAAKLGEANHNAASRFALMMTEERKLGLAGETLAKSNNWKFTGVVLKGASVALAGYSIYLSYEDFKSAVGSAASAAK